MLNVFRGSVVAAALAIGVASGPVFAQTINYNTYSVPNAATVRITNPNNSFGNDFTVGAGRITLDNATSTNWIGAANINAWCIDLANTLTAPAAYTLGTLVDTALKTRLNALLNGAASAVSSIYNVNNVVDNGALQVAIWKTVYPSSLYSATFTMDQAYSGVTAGVEARATQYLNFVTANTWQASATLDIAVLNPSPNANSTQKLITLVSRSTGAPPGVNVPEPASIALITVGLAGIAVARRRRRTMH